MLRPVQLADSYDSRPIPPRGFWYCCSQLHLQATCSLCSAEEGLGSALNHSLELVPLDQHPRILVIVDGPDFLRRVLLDLVDADGDGLIGGKIVLEREHFPRPAVDLCQDSVHLIRLARDLSAHKGRRVVHEECRPTTAWLAA
eukprot:7380539-Prymnesium_polylepis.2